MRQASLPDHLPRVFLAGCGRVGTAVTILLQQAGHPVAGVASRTRASAERAAASLGAPLVEWDHSDLPAAEILVVGASDDAIGDVAHRFAGSLTDNGMAVHLAGSLGLEPLHAVTGMGRHAAALHPVQACPDIATAVARLPGAAWGVTCSDGARAFAHDLVGVSLKGHPVDVAGPDRALWHAAAVMTSNGIAALLAYGESILAAIGIDEPERVLGPLAEGTVANAVAGGGGGATLTGPIVRGEGATVKRHLTALRSRYPQLAAGYEGVADLILNAAVRSERISEADRSFLEQILDPA